jgi:hypothetical protein
VKDNIGKTLVKTAFMLLLALSVMSASIAFAQPPNASISLTKTPSATKVLVGSSVSYLYNATNTGETDLTGAIYDDVFGHVGSFVNLQPGGWVGFNVTHVLTQNTTNLATAYGVDGYGHNVTSTASAFVQVYYPNASISLTKTPSATKVLVGSSVSYLYNATNTGETDLTGAIYDDKLGPVGTFTDLQPGSSICFTKTSALTVDTYNVATVTVTDSFGQELKATACSFVRVCWPSTHPVLTVTSPNGGENLVPGLSYSIKWSSAGRVGSYVKIELLKDGVVDRILAYRTANDGYYRWYIPSRLTPRTDYQIRITSTSKAITDSSDCNFAISSGVDRTLTLTSPIGGERWRRGTVHTITWLKSGSTGSYVKIELLKDGEVDRIITYRTANDGYYRWYIPSRLTPRTDYQIRITSTAYKWITDLSNFNFIIAW